MAEVRPMLILVVDDDPLVREVLTDFLATQGHTVLAAGTIADGYAQATRHSPELVLLDLWLPDGLGDDLLPRLRALTPAPRVVVISGNVLPAGAGKYIELGADRVILKPFRLEDIEAALHAICVAH